MRTISIQEPIDFPITSASQDLLGRQPFIEVLVSSLEGWSAKESLVVCLHAACGAGKTSVKNLLVGALKESTSDWQVIEFNPWRNFPTDRLDDRFFDELAVLLRESSRQESAEIATTLRRYARRLQGTSDVLRILAKMAALLFSVTLAFVGPWILQISARWRAAIVAVTLLILLSSWGQSLLLGLASMLFPDAVDTAKSLDTVKQELVQGLRVCGKQLLVVLDDLDRLTPLELVQMLRIVKAHGDFPNVTYLLLCDKHIVTCHIHAALGVDGASFLEKIVQIDLSIPKVSKWRLEEIFFKGLDDILASGPILGDFDAPRWQQVFPLLSSYFSTLRSVNRFLATVTFRFNTVAGAALFELDAVDPIAVEVLRAFEPRLYDALPAYRSSLVESSRWGSPSQSDYATDKLALLSHVAETGHKQVSQLLNSLFPLFEAFLDGRTVQDYEQITWSKKMRVGSMQHFDKYFEFFLDPRKVSRSDVSPFLLSGCSAAQLQNTLLLLQRRNLLVEAVDALKEIVDDIPKANLINATVAICNVADDIPAVAVRMFGLSPLSQTEFLVRSLLERSAASHGMEPGIEEIIEKSEGLALPVYFVFTILKELQSEGISFGVDRSNAESLKAVVVSRIEASAKANTLTRNQHLRLLVEAWMGWGDPQNAKRYAAENCSRQKTALIFLRSLTCTLHSSTLNREGGTARHYLRHADFDRLEIADRLDETFADVDTSLLDTDDVRTLALLKKALSKRARGIPDEDIASWRDDDEA